MPTPTDTPPPRWVAALILVYLFIVAVLATMLVALNFPHQVDTKFVFPNQDGTAIYFASYLRLASADQALVLLAFLAGAAGSFLRSAPSLTSYVGNGTFQTSWAAWYLMRPGVGAILGVAVYFAFRAGLIAGATGVNPYGVVAIATLGGWFSKTTTDKLKEVFEVLFRTDEDRNRLDKLLPDGTDR